MSELLPVIEENPESSLSALQAMNTTFCHIRHHRSWLPNQSSDICPQSVRDNSLGCVHSSAPILKNGIESLFYLQRITQEQGTALLSLLRSNKRHVLWQTDMFANACDRAISTDGGLARTPQAIEERQSLLGVSRDECPVELLTPAIADRLIAQKHEEAGQLRRELRQLLIECLSPDADIECTQRKVTDFITRHTGEAEESHY